LQPIGDFAQQVRSLDGREGSRLEVAEPHDELGRLGTSFNALLDRVDSVLAQQRRFLSDAAHELRTPIARLRGRVELGRHASASETAHTLAALDRELRHTSDVLDRLLALARADADAESVRLTAGYLDDALSDEIARWREAAEVAGMRVVLGPFVEVPARFDAALMRRLLALLLDNAVRYGASGDTITVSLTREAQTARLRVDDEGIGIAPAEREAVFSRFHRTSAARAHRADGSGLGLALARWIVQRHGGTIRAESRADGRAGASLVVELPVVGEATHAGRGRGDAVGLLPGAA
jgi:signal transduction histidine kinase